MELEKEKESAKTEMLQNPLLSEQLQAFKNMINEVEDE